MLRHWKFGLLFLGILFNGAPIFAAPLPEDAKVSNSCCALFEEAQAKYFPEHQYREFINFLSTFKDKNKAHALCVNYYQALARFNQLKYLEEKQSWDEYFASGNDYRQEIVENIDPVIAQTQGDDCLRVKSRLLIWQFHFGQQDAFTQQALTDLMADLNLYAQAKNDPLLLKEAADILSAAEQKSQAREIYKLYSVALVTGETDDTKLKTIAAGFYKDGNLDLAQTVYDIYIERISKSFTPDKMVSELFEIASLFVYKASGLADPVYAEKIYLKIAALGQKDAFNEESIYLRAFNLEKIKEYGAAKDLYSQLIQRYPETRHFDEVVYKVGMINVYVGADLSMGQSYFEKLIAKSPLSAHGVAALYQLGLLAQWQGDFIKAKADYDALLKNAGEKYVSSVREAQARLNELKAAQPLSYNLQTFLDLVLKPEKTTAGMNSAELQSSAYILEKNQSATISAQVAMPESGCNRVELQYLWSGSLGEKTPGTTESNFQGTYNDPGTKEINLVIVSPGGALEHSFVMVDVY